MRVNVRRQQPADFEAAKIVYAEAFTRPDRSNLIPPEVGLFARLWEARDVIDGFRLPRSSSTTRSWVM